MSNGSWDRMFIYYTSLFIATSHSRRGTCWSVCFDAIEMRLSVWIQDSSAARSASSSKFVSGKKKSVYAVMIRQFLHEFSSKLGSWLQCLLDGWWWCERILAKFLLVFTEKEKSRRVRGYRRAVQLSTYILKLWWLQVPTHLGKMYGGQCIFSCLQREIRYGGEVRKGSGEPDQTDWVCDSTTPRDLVRASNDAAVLGFVRDPRRLNILITRQTRGFWIVGDERRCVLTLGEQSEFDDPIPTSEDKTGVDENKEDKTDKKSTEDRKNATVIAIFDWMRQKGRVVNVADDEYTDACEGNRINRRNWGRTVAFQKLYFEYLYPFNDWNQQRKSA